MRFTSAVIASTFAGFAAATNFTVMVGMGGLKYVPSNITAQPNDFVTFVFTVKNHTITQSSFADPCTPLAGGFDSGYVFSNNTMTNYTIQVTTDKPVWAFCSQATATTGNHCHKGMVFSINPDAGQNKAAGNATSAADFLFNAQKLGVNDPPLVSATAAASATASASGDAASGSPAPADSASGSDSSAPTDSASGSIQFPSGDSNSGAPAATGSDSSSASATGDIANAGAAATSAGDNVSSTSSAAAAATTSAKNGARSLARSSAGVLGAVGLVVALVL